MLTTLVHPTDAGVGTLDPLVFQLGFSRLLPHHLRWNPIFCCLPPPRTLLLVNEGMGVAAHDPQHRQSQMLAVASRSGQVDFPQFPGILEQEHASLQTKVISPSSAIIRCSSLPTRR